MATFEPREFVRRPVRRKPQRLLPAVILAVVLGVLGGLLLHHYLGMFAKEGTDPHAKPREVTPRGDLWPEEQRIVELYEKARKSAVTIYLLDANRQSVGSGSGFIWDRDGRVVTNAHVA